MNCPKCGFEAPSGEVSCAKCGVVFAKLGRERPAPPNARESSPSGEPAGPHATEGSLFFNVLVPAALLCAAGLYAYQWWSAEPDAASEVPLASPEASPARPELVVELPGGGRPAEPLILSGLPKVPSPSPATPEDVESPDLPDLRSIVMTDGLLEQAKQVARDHPGEDWIREYVVAAHFLLAGQAIRKRRYDRALRYLDDSEEWAASPGDVATFRAVIYAAQEEWDVARSWAETAIAYRSRANPAEMHHILGKAYYYREQMDKAIEELEKALAIKDDPAIRASLERARQEAQTADGFRSRRLAHFIVRYDGGSESTGRMVIDTMDRSYASLVSQLGFEPKEPVVVILYSRQDYRKMGGPHWSAGLFDGKIRVPVRGLERLDEQIKTTLHHELAHAFIHSRAGNAAPRWLHEGLAEYVEGTRTTDHGELLGKAIGSGRSFESCLPTARCDVRLFYPAAASMVDYMIQKRGMGGIRDVLNALGDGEDIDGAMRRVMGADVDAFIRDWEHFIRRRYG